MKKNALLQSLKHNRDIGGRLSIVRKLGDYLDEVDVVRSLCYICVSTDSHKLRTSIIELLKRCREMANHYFTYIAIYAKKTNNRKWALVNLSLLECRNARIAVIHGLQDSSSAVQQAAVLNISLYHDADFLRKVEQYFERNGLKLMLHSMFCSKDAELVS